MTVLTHESLNFLFWIQIIGFLIGGLGFISFLDSARLLLTFVLGFITRPGTGLNVTSPFPDAIGGFGAALFYVPFVLSFFPPCYGYFSKPAPMPAGAVG